MYVVAVGSPTAKAHTWNGNKLFNGVDNTHTERFFPAKKWTKLGIQGQKILNDCPKSKAKKEALMMQNKSKACSASTQNSKHNVLSSQQKNLTRAVINGVMQSSTSVTDDDTLISRYIASACAHMPQIDTHATCNTSAVSTRYFPTYNHHGNAVQE